MAYPQAKRCLYKGIWFKSNLEGKVAEALDRLDVAWQYEPVVVRGPRFAGGQYTPDFYLPMQNAYIEAAGRWDGRHASNVAEFARQMGCAPLVSRDGRGAPLMLCVDGRGYLRDACSGEPDEDAGSQPFVMRCARCGGVSILSGGGSWRCQCCGEHDGDHHFAESFGDNLFDAAGVRRYGGD